MKLIQQAKDNPGLTAALGGIALVAVSFSQLERVAWLIQAPGVAYAAKGQADETADEFEQYLIEQRAYTRAINDYVAQQQQQVQQYAPEHEEPYREWDEEGRCWEWDVKREDWFACRVGK